MNENEPQGNSQWLETFGLALEDRVECDSAACSEPANWWYRFVCCNTVCFGCDEHTTGLVQKLMALQNEQKPAKCGYCGRLMVPLKLIAKPERLALDSAT